MSRLLAEPETLAVEVTDGIPRRVRWGRQLLPVERVFARWRVASDWWRTPVSREYWKLCLGDRVVCEIYQDRLSQEWWLSRIYD